MYYRGPDISADFQIIPIEAVQGQIFWGMEMGVRGRDKLKIIILNWKYTVSLKHNNLDNNIEKNVHLNHR